MGRPVTAAPSEPLYADIEADLLARVRALAFREQRTLRWTIEKLLEAGLRVHSKGITPMKK